MFIVVSNPAEQTYTVPVTVEMLDEQGKKKNHVFKAKFRRLSREELDQLTDRIKNAQRADDDGFAEDKVKDSELIHDVMVGWEDVADEHKVPLPFNAETLNALINVHPVRPTIVKAFFKSVYGAASGN